MGKWARSHSRFLTLGRILVFVTLVGLAGGALANVAPVVDGFAASPATLLPGQVALLTLDAHDPDCASTCNSGCGTYIRSDRLVWTDDSGRAVTGAFQNSNPGTSQSPWHATVEWIAPAAEGTYTVTATIADSGTMLCGGSKVTYGSLKITVSSATPPVIDSFTVSPNPVQVGGAATLSVAAHDPLNRPLTYTFSADSGTVVAGRPADTQAQWTAPLVAGSITVRCAVSAGAGATANAQTTAQVTIGAFSGWLRAPGTWTTRVTALPNGNFLLVDTLAGRVVSVSPSGFVAWSISGLSEPVAAAATSQIYVLERKAKRIQVLSLTGTSLMTFPCTGEALTDVVAGPGFGDLTVSDMGAARLYVITVQTQTVRLSLGDGTLVSPSGLASRSGKIAVADPGLRRVVVFDASGNVLSILGDDTLFVRPQGVAWDSANARLMVADSFTSQVTVLGEDGSFRGVLGGFGSDAGQLSAPSDAELSGSTLAVPVASSGTVALFQVQAGATALAFPTAVNAGDLPGDDGGAILVSWTRSTDDPARVVSYRVERATPPSADLVPIGRVQAGTTSFVDSPTVDGTCYTYRVVASDGLAEAASPATPCATSRNDLPPDAPPWVTAEATSPTAGAVRWGASRAADLKGYTVQITGPESPRSVAVPAGRTDASLTGLTPERTYFVSVTAIDVAGNVSPSAATAAFNTYPDVPPPTPANVAARDTERGAEVEVSWTEAAGRVPVAGFHITLTPLVAGWPVVEQDATQSPARVAGLIDRLAYVVTVTAVTPWGRASAPSAAVSVTPTAPPRDLPVLSEVGFNGDVPGELAAGIRINLPAQDGTRQLKLEYRADRTSLRMFFDGLPFGEVLPDTQGAWSVATLTIPEEVRVRSAGRTAESVAARVVDIRNLSFPNPQAVMSLRKIDLVPLPVDEMRSQGFNTVVDVSWRLKESRPDLVVNVARRTSSSAWTSLPCKNPLGPCRDTFLPNGEKQTYGLVVASPAGWLSPERQLEGKAEYDALPPPVTDLVLSRDTSAAGEAWLLSWTALSSAADERSAPQPVSVYRVFRRDAGGLTYLFETAAPSARLPLAALDPARPEAAVRSVDLLGRESK